MMIIYHIEEEAKAFLKNLRDARNRSLPSKCLVSLVELEICLMRFLMELGQSREEGYESKH